MSYFDQNDPESSKQMREMFGPGHVDQQIRQAIQFCWMMLPADRRNTDELEKEMRRMLDRALRDMREDAERFGLRN